MISSPEKRKKEKSHTFATMGWVDPVALEDNEHNHERGYDVFAGCDNSLKLTDIKVAATDIHDPSTVPKVIIEQIPNDDWSDEVSRTTLCVDCVYSCAHVAFPLLSAVTICQ